MASARQDSMRLVAVLLVTRTRSGPKLVFSYPPNPRNPTDDNNNEDDSDSDSGSDAERPSMPTPLRLVVGNDPEIKAANVTKQDSKGSADESFLGISEESLEKLLSPSCWCDRKKFEASIDGITFVGHPIHAAKDGSWAHRHNHDTTPQKKKNHVRDVNHSETMPSPVENGEENSNEKPGITITEPKTPAKVVTDFTHVPDSFESSGDLSFGTSMNSGSTTSAAMPEPLICFNVVFALAGTHSGRTNTDISDIHEHVIKKLCKALRYCQKHDSYVGTQSRKLLALKQKAKLEGIGRGTLCNQMLENCELAWALKEVYDKIAAGGVANIRFEGEQMSLFLPSKNKQVEAEIDRHFALLLLEDVQLLTRDLTHPEASALAYFLRGHTPTKSLQKLANKLGMNIDHVLHLARYLITWQKARAITPLHIRNVYTIDPEAPLNHLQDHIIEFSRMFPVLPSLPQVLEGLSGRPIKYGRLIPSRDHREPYMAILAYLVRNRFVQQLKTSGWLQAPTTSRKRPSEATINQNRRPLSVASLLSPQLRPVDDDAASVSSERTAIPLASLDTITRRSISNTHSRSESETEKRDDSFAMIKSPLNPSAEDLLRLRHIKDAVGDTELADRLPSLVRYFDGEAMFEDIGAKEGLKRSRVDAWLDTLEQEGFLITFRHL